MIRWVLAIVVLAAAPTRADTSERSDRARIWHIAPFAVGGGVYLALEFGLKERLTPDRCRWCRSNWFDSWFRGAKWERVHAADTASNLTGYVLTPLVTIGSLLAVNAGERDWRLWFDDVVPVLQAGIVTGVVNQATKLVFVRRRPFAEFGGVSVQTRKGDENASFFSGHTALAFALATSAGTVAELRGYGVAPLIWITGGALAAGTGYLRIASDAHYTSDVLAGAVIGTAIGLAIPLLFHRDVLEDPAPAAREAAVVSLGGRF